MFASFWPWWTSSEHQSFDNDRQQPCSNFCQHPQNSLMVPWTWALPMGLKAPWLTSSAAGNFIPPDSATWLRSRKEVRAEFIRRNQDNAEKAEVSNTVVTRFPAPLSSGPAFFFSSPHSWFQGQLSCGFPVTLSLSMHVSAKPLYLSLVALACFPLGCTSFWCELCLELLATQVDLLLDLLDFQYAGKDCPCAPSPSGLQSSLPCDPAKIKSTLVNLFSVY